jgi:hypothetical protein
MSPKHEMMHPGGMRLKQSIDLRCVCVLWPYLAETRSHHPLLKCPALLDVPRFTVTLHLPVLHAKKTTYEMQFLGMFGSHWTDFHEIL